MLEARHSYFLCMMDFDDDPNQLLSLRSSTAQGWSDSGRVDSLGIRDYLL